MSHGPDLRQILDTTAEAICGLDNQGRFTFANAAGLRLLNYAAENDLVGQPLASHLRPSQQASRNEPAQRLLHAIHEGKADHGSQIKIWPRNGASPLSGAYWLRPMPDQAGSVLSFTAMSLHQANRSHQVQLEQRFTECNAALEATRKELDAFCYAISHDLRAPLRAIDGFSQALEEELADTLDALQRDYLARVRKASRRMEQLIDDLLRLARLSQQTPRLETVDLANIAHLVATRLKETQPERDIVFEIQNPMPALADPRMIHTVLSKLLDNAWKYTSKTRHARVEVGMIEQQRQTVFFVRDNGAGFDMRYAGKLFNAFQRLHHSHEFPGSGTGLATVARIIHRHQGRIWAEAEVNRGATFFFTLQATPYRPQDQD